MGRLRVLLMSHFHVELPFPISVNQMYRSPPGKKVMLSREYRSWKEKAEVAILKANLTRYKKDKTRKFVWTYTSQLYVPANKFYTLDLDNYFKGPIDLISKALNIDDRYLIEEKRYKVQTPGNAGISFDIRVFISLVEYDRKTMCEEF